LPDLVVTWALAKYELDYFSKVRLTGVGLSMHFVEHTKHERNYTVFLLKLSGFSEISYFCTVNL